MFVKPVEDVAEETLAKDRGAYGTSMGAVDGAAFEVAETAGGRDARGADAAVP
jgi:hypothetical protein